MTRREETSRHRRGYRRRREAWALECARSRTGACANVGLADATVEQPQRVSISRPICRFPGSQVGSAMGLIQPLAVPTANSGTGPFKLPLLVAALAKRYSYKRSVVRRKLPLSFGGRFGAVETAALTSSATETKRGGPRPAQGGRFGALVVCCFYQRPERPSFGE